MNHRQRQFTRWSLVREPKHPLRSEYDPVHCRTIWRHKQQAHMLRPRWSDFKTSGSWPARQHVVTLESWMGHKQYRACQTPADEAPTYAADVDAVPELASRRNDHAGRKCQQTRAGAPKIAWHRPEKPSAGRQGWRYAWFPKAITFFLLDMRQEHANTDTKKGTPAALALAGWDNDEETMAMSTSSESSSVLVSGLYLKKLRRSSWYLYNVFSQKINSTQSFLFVVKRNEVFKIFGQFATVFMAK